MQLCRLFHESEPQLSHSMCCAGDHDKGVSLGPDSIRPVQQGNVRSWVDLGISVHNDCDRCTQSCVLLLTDLEIVVLVVCYVVRENCLTCQSYFK